MPKAPKTDQVPGVKTCPICKKGFHHKGFHPHLKRCESEKIAEDGLREYDSELRARSFPQLNGACYVMNFANYAAYFLFFLAFRRSERDAHITIDNAFGSHSNQEAQGLDIDSKEHR
jgi:hypothetical protein